MKCAIVVSSPNHNLPSVCYESIERYATKVQAELVLDPILDGDTGPIGGRVWQHISSLMCNAFERFDRVLLINSSVLVTEGAPNIFDEVNPECLGVARVDLGRDSASKLREVESIQHELGDVGWTQGVFSADVIVGTKAHHLQLWKSQIAFDKYQKKGGQEDWRAENFLNWRARQLNFRIQLLERRWNHKTSIESHTLAPRTDSWFINYSGSENAGQLIADDVRINTAKRYWDHRSKMSWNQVEWILRQAGSRLDGELLMFGLGCNALMWSKLCKATFLEDQENVYRKAFEKPENQSLTAYLVNYRTRVRNWESDLANHTLNTLPPEVNSKRFDAIIIDGPRGSRDGSPGRVSPILHAKRLVATGGKIFLNNVDRELVSQVGKRVFGQADATWTDSRAVQCWHFS